MDIQDVVSQTLVEGHPRFENAVIPVRTYIDRLEPRAFHIVLDAPLPMTPVARLEWSGHQSFRQGGFAKNDHLSVFIILEAYRADGISMWQVALLGQAAFQAWQRWCYLEWYRLPSLSAPEHLLCGLQWESTKVNRSHGCIMADDLNLTRTFEAFTGV